ncbi:HNH endonuclease [Neptunomonas qingdaonensis]|uniref:HNH endonuclease n=1 Tax=Neptunomonas qingdaonensis TaxID=1045558 RepID=A0A1I2NEP9_9GAMM|nr:hypothetical protein [Neptunomonas qingdaonensis]SFG01319.1 hypothetical protein SAMN05216175_102412 [Neptunomonas qingdaonensis]
MKKLPYPPFSFEDAYQASLDNVGVGTDLYTRLLFEKQLILDNEDKYKQKAESLCLHTFQCARHGHSEDKIVGDVTKDDLKILYETYFLKESTAARDIYEAIKASTGGVCPICGFGSVHTLDHYLPKSRYHLFSVLPINLVPACRDCNTGKGSSVISQPEMLSIHPYFDDSMFFDERWIRGTVRHDTIPIVTYSVYPPATWSALSKERVETHFVAFGLGDAFSVQATTEMTTAIETVRGLLPIMEEGGVSGHFHRISQCHQPNSWRSIFYITLAEDDWFCRGGFLD